MLLIVVLPWSIAPMSIATAACAALTVPLWLLDRDGASLRNPVTPAAVGWLAALGLSAAFAVDPSASLPRLGKGVFPALVALGAYHARSSRAAATALAALMGSAGLAWLLALGVFATHGMALEARARGPVGHYMTFGGQLLLLTSLAAGVAAATRGGWRRAAIGLAALGAIALLATYTRSAWIGFGVSLAVILGLTRPRVIAVIAALATLVLLFGPQATRDRALSIVDPHHPANRERTYMWEAGARMFRDHPLTGVGLQDLKPIYDRYRDPAAHERPGHLHSVPVNLAATMGVIGLAAFVWLYASLFVATAGGLRSALRARRRWDGAGEAALGVGVRLGVTGALAGFLAAGLFEWNIGDEELLYLLYVLVGIAWAARGWGGPPAERPPREKVP